MPPSATSPPDDPDTNTPRAPTSVRLAGLIAGPAIFAVMLAAGAPDGLSPAGWRTAALAVWMAAWWVSEAAPLPVTALLPIPLLPALGIANVGETTAPYANPVIFLFLGGFVIARGLESAGLHRRIALAILAAAGGGAERTIAGFMVATAALSMWISNTAACVMMLPIALSVIDGAAADAPADRRRFAVALLLGIAYAASIGGLGTLIGTPPNALLAGYMAQTHGVEIGFGRWMLLGVPLVAVLLPLVWLALTRIVCRAGGRVRVAGGDHARTERAALGKMGRAEWIVAGVFALVAVAWVGRPLLEKLLSGPGAGSGLGLSDAGIAVAGAIALFLIPVDPRRGRFVLTWRDARTLPWGILILFGGGLSLAGAIAASGLAGWIGAGLAGLATLPTLAVLAIAIALVVFLTELTSNTATAAAFLPVAGALAASLGLAPLDLAAPVALAASCAFMMPVATPPNAIVFGSGRLAIADMVRAGIVANLIAIAALVALARPLARLVA